MKVGSRPIQHCFGAVHNIESAGKIKLLGYFCLNSRAINCLYEFILCFCFYFIFFWIILSRSKFCVYPAGGVWLHAETVLTTHSSKAVLFSTYLDNLENSYS